MKKVFVYSLLFSFSFSLLSCGPSHLVVRDQPTPPAVVVQPVAPRPGYVYIDGYWYRRGGSYQYRNGYYGRPRRSGVYVPGHWVATPGGYYWQRGYWRR